MNRRQAKREACWRAVSVLQTALDGGDWLAAHYPDEDDEMAVSAGVLELIEELTRRGSQ